MEYFIYISFLDLDSEETRKKINPNYAFSMGFHDNCLKIFSPDGQIFWANDDLTISLENPLGSLETSLELEDLETTSHVSSTSMSSMSSTSLNSCWNVHKRHER